MNTAFLLMAQYNGQAVIPIDAVARDYFAPLTVQQLLRKASSGGIALPIVRMTPTQKCAKGVHLQDLATYLDTRRAAAVKEMEQLRAA